MGNQATCLGRPAWGDLTMSRYTWLYSQNVGQPSHVLGHVIVYISIGKASSRPGQPRQPHHLYECEYIHTIEMKSWQSAEGGLPRATLPRLHINVFRHGNWETKQPARGGLPRPASPVILLYMCIHSYKAGKASSLPARPAWGSLTISLYTCT